MNTNCWTPKLGHYLKHLTEAEERKTKENCCFVKNSILLFLYSILYLQYCEQKRPHICTIFTLLTLTSNCGTWTVFVNVWNMEKKNQIFYGTVCCFTLPQNQVDHTFCCLVEASQDLYKDSPFFPHPVEGQAKNKRPGNQAQCVGSVNVMAHQSHFSCIL